MMYLQLAWRNIWRNRRRTLITMGSVFFAIILAVVMRSAVNGVYDNMVNNLVSFSTGYIQIHHKGYWEEQSLERSFVEDKSLTDRFADWDVGAIVPRLETFSLISSGDHTRGVKVLGIDPEKEKAITGIDKKIVAGTFPAINTNGIIIGKALARILKIEIGDTLVLLGQGYHASMAAALLPVVAIISMGTPQLEENVVFVPLNRCREIYSADNLLTSLCIMIPSAGRLEEYKNIISPTIDTTKYELMTWKEMMPELNQFIEVDSAGNYIAIFILYLVISFGLFGTILMMTKERMHEFGILVAIGMKKRILTFIVVAEMILISITGAAAGIVASIPVVWYFKLNPIRFTGQLEQVYIEFGVEPIIPFSSEPGIFITQGVIVFCLAVILGLYPFFKIINLRPVQAINS